MTVRRKLGEATTVHERNVENAIERVPPWRGREASYTPLVGGLMNQNWLVEIAGDPRRYFIKVPGEGSEMFIDRVAANEAARNAHAMGIAPEVIFFDAQDGLEVSEFLECYRACTNGDFGDAAIQSDVLDLYRRLHAGPKLSLNQDDLRHDRGARRTGPRIGLALFRMICPGSCIATARPRPRSWHPASTSYPASTIRCPEISSLAQSWAPAPS